MTTIQQERLIKMGSAINIKVTPVSIDGNNGVSYCSNGYTSDFDVAYRELHWMEITVCEAA